MYFLHRYSSPVSGKILFSGLVHASGTFLVPGPHGNFLCENLQERTILGQRIGGFGADPGSILQNGSCFLLGIRLSFCARLVRGESFLRGIIVLLAAVIWTKNLIVASAPCLASPVGSGIPFGEYAHLGPPFLAGTITGRIDGLAWSGYWETFEIGQQAIDLDDSRLDVLVPYAGADPCTFVVLCTDRDSRRKARTDLAYHLDGPRGFRMGRLVPDQLVPCPGFDGIGHLPA